MNTSRRPYLFAAVTAGALVLIGCKSIGPGTVQRDRSDYSSSISESWKRQTLLNIIKLRYMDPPTFVEVGQIVAGYSLQTGVSAGGTLSTEKAIQGNFLAANGQAIYTDRPTVTYVPLTGNKFIKGLMTPLPPEAVFFTIQSGYPADGVLFAAVAEINGLKNQSASVDGVSPPDPNFMRVLQLMRKIQLSGAVAMRIKQDAAKQQTSILAFRSKDVPQPVLDDIHELRRLLRIDPDAAELTLVYGSSSTNDKEIAVLTRSMLQMMGIMASEADVPDEDVAQGRATPGWEDLPGKKENVSQSSAAPGEKTIANAGRTARLIRIHSGKSEPADTFVAVQYRNRWFWIDDRDLKSKRSFSFMMMLFTLADTGDKENLPLITIPAQ